MFLFNPFPIFVNRKKYLKKKKKSKYKRKYLDSFHSNEFHFERECNPRETNSRNMRNSEAKNELQFISGFNLKITCASGCSR